MHFDDQCSAHAQSHSLCLRDTKQENQEKNDKKREEVECTKEEERRDEQEDKESSSFAESTNREKIRTIMREK